MEWWIGRGRGLERRRRRDRRLSHLVLTKRYHPHLPHSGCRHYLHGAFLEGEFATVLTSGTRPVRSAEPLSRAL